MPLTAAETVRFKRAFVDGPPYCWNLLKIVDKSTGEAIQDMISADAERGTYCAYKPGDSGKLIRQGDHWEKHQTDADIEIMLDQKHLPKGFVYDNCAADIEADAIYEEHYSDI